MLNNTNLQLLGVGPMLEEPAGSQQLSLASGCWYHGIVIHEIGATQINTLARKKITYLT